jgi:formate-dependent nitrite reductase membrane component NrfD
MVIGCVYFGTSLLYIILFFKILVSKLHFKWSQVVEYVASLDGLLIEIQDNAGYSISGSV